MSCSLVAYCGLACDSCPIFLATLEEDRDKRQAMRVEIARICSEQYGMNLLISDITDCDGCRAKAGRLFIGCRNCEIRNCAVNKGLDSCAFCDEYACEKLRKFFDADPDARVRLEAQRSMREGQR